MGARQSYNLSKRSANCSHRFVLHPNFVADFDQTMKDVLSPIDSLPSHLLCIIDERAKIRLSRVCRRFYSCIRLEESWRFNTELNTQRLTSPEALLAFVQRVPQVRILNLGYVEADLGWLRPQVLEHARKFRISKLHVRGDRTDTIAFLKHCLEYLSPSLTHLNLQRLDSEDILRNFVAKCNALQDVSFSDVSAPSKTVLESLGSKPLKNLELSPLAGSGIDKIEGRCLAAFENSVPGRAPVMSWHGYKIVGANDFCRQLCPSYARIMQEVHFTVETVDDEELFEYIRRVSLLLPNVDDVSITPTKLHVIPSACLGCMQAFKFVFDSAEHRPKTISLLFRCNIHITIANSFAAGWAWFNAFDTVFGSNDGYEIGIHDGNDPFKRTMSKGQATVTLICY